MKKVKNQPNNKYVLECQLCSTITTTPKFASYGTILQCSECSVNLAYCDNLYEVFKNTDLIWKIWEYPLKNDDGIIEIIKPKIHKF
jgi:hypothetical protein